MKTFMINLTEPEIILLQGLLYDEYVRLDNIHEIDSQASVTRLKSCVNGIEKKLNVI